MEFLELAKKRYSVRKYESRKVEKEKLLKILEAGRIAPTAANLQPHSIIVVETSEALEKLGKCARVYGAPLALIVCANHDVSWKRPFDNKDTADIDASIVTDHMMLQTTELGLGSVWICYFNQKVLREEFGLPDNIEPINILAIGYPAGEAAALGGHDKARKALNDIVSYV